MVSASTQLWTGGVKAGFLTFFLVVIVVLVGVLALLEQESLLVKDQVVEDTGKENAFKHDQVADDFTCEECVLQLLVLDEVV